MEKETSCCSTATENKEKKVDTCCSSNIEKELSLKVSGMDCPSCAATIEKSLQKISGVTSAKVNYPKASLTVHGNNFDEQQITQTVKKLGFSTEQPIKTSNSEIYLIEGMDCGSCAATIEKHMRSLPEVNDIKVNFSTGKMSISHQLNSDIIKKEVEKTGFRASLENDEKYGEPVNKKWNPTLFSGISLVAAIGLRLLTDLEMLTTILLGIAIVIAGLKPFKSAFYGIKSRSLDMNVLMSGAALGAVVIGEWLEGAMVLWLFSLGTWLQTKSVEKTRKSISDLMKLSPDVAFVKRGNEVIEEPVEQIKVNDVIVVKPGQKVGLDGVILQGESLVNEAPITGEALPAEKTVNDNVYAGTLNEDGVIEVKVTKTKENTALAKIITLVEEAQDKKAPTEDFVDRFARIYTPIVFVAALLLIFVPPVIGLGSWADWFYRGLELLVIACPCALVISTPVAIVSAIGNAARQGVLIKGGTFLELAGKLNAFAFDKTGTLTEGKPKVDTVKVFNGTEEDLLAIAKTIEEQSTHPIANAVVEFTEERGINSLNGSSFKALSGKGAQGTIDQTVFFAGNMKLFEEENITLSEKLMEEINNLKSQGQSIVIIGSATEILGYIGVRDVVRNTSAKALQNLKEIGIKQTIMLTGDHEGTAKIIAKDANVDRYFANLLPEEKLDHIKKLQSEGLRVGMVGDGINDAPALATADIGIAMGGAGTDTSIETADIVLMADNLSQLPFTVRLSRKALAIIKQNVWFSILVKAAALLLIIPDLMTLWIAILSDTGAALLVILNSMRLLRIK